MGTATIKAPPVNGAESNGAKKDQRLTNSEIQCAKTCMRKHFLQYRRGIRTVTDAPPLRVGSCFHEGQDLYNKGATVNEAMLAAVSPYDGKPDLYVEREITARMLAGHIWRWELEKLDIIESEKVFVVPIINPETERASRTYKLAGKIDGIARLSDGNLSLVEYKTTSDNLDPTGDYFARIRIDMQVSLYIIAAQQMGHDINRVLYDVTRKFKTSPTKLTQGATKQLQETGRHIVDDVLIGEYEITCDGDKISHVDGFPVEIIPGKKGYAIRETVQMMGDRIAKDMNADPNKYFSRQIFMRTENDLLEARHELWQMAQIMGNSQRTGMYPRNTGACIGFGKCPYFRLCTNGFTGSDEDMPMLPDAFKVVADKHQELIA